ncbi:hypothetical protein NX059_003126 [Plenodomus lindquistii]|nr:hypothetical protein NX059_003126 [Plenodomus lindquistii]
MIADIELGVYHDGYPALAHWMAQDPDNETLIFRKFDDLSTRNLLYMQAELFALQRSIIEIETQMANCNDVMLIESARRWETLIVNANANGVQPRPEKELMRLIAESKVRLKEYHEALVLQSQIAGLGRPSSRALGLFKRWFQGHSRDTNGQKAFPIIDGEASRMLDHEDDLAALKVPEEDDRLSQLLRDHWPLRGQTGTNPKDNTRYFRLRHVTRTVAVISTVVAAVELVGAITSLYFVSGPKARIGLIACFTSLFGMSLCLLTNARRGEVFGASAAYAAVLVVFVSGDLGGPTSRNLSTSMGGNG